MIVSSSNWLHYSFVFSCCWFSASIQKRTAHLRWDCSPPSPDSHIVIPPLWTQPKFHTSWTMTKSWTVSKISVTISKTSSIILQLEYFARGNILHEYKTSYPNVFHQSWFRQRVNHKEINPCFPKVHGPKLSLDSMTPAPWAVALILSPHPSFLPDVGFLWYTMSWLLA